MTIYEIVLLTHSYLRWIVLLLLVAVVARCLVTTSSADWSRTDERSHLALVAAADVQLLLGLWLYLVASPIAAAFRADPKGAMHDAPLRFFGVEHLTSMVLALVALHVGRVLSKRARDARSRRIRVLGWTVASLVCVMVGIPWPFLRYGRPLLRPMAFHSSAGGTGPGGPSSACPPAYTERCVTCHGDRGRGDGPAASSLKPGPRNFTDRMWAESKSDTELRNVIREGGAARGLSPGMPPQPDLSDRDLDELVTCIRSF